MFIVDKHIQDVEMSKTYVEMQKRDNLSNSKFTLAIGYKSAMIYDVINKHEALIGRKWREEDIPEPMVRV